MKASFLSALALAAFACQASAQTSNYFQSAPSTCAGGQCPRVSAAVQTVRSTVADGFHAVGNLVAPPVQGYWSSPGATPWYPQLPASVPQQMAEPQKRQPLFPRLHHLVTGK